MKKDERVQVSLLSDNRYMTCWVDKAVKVGDKITLKDYDDPTMLWTVLKVSEPKALASINTNRNFKVGGL